MKKFAIIITLLTVAFSITYAQVPADTITVKKIYGGYQFYQGNKLLKMNQLVNAVKPNEQAFKQIKSAQSNYVLANIIGGVGGFMVGWPLGTAMGGGKPEWAMAGVGAVLIGISIPISITSGKKAKQAVDIFNDGLQTSSFLHKSELKFSVTQNGLGFSLNF